MNGGIRIKASWVGDQAIAVIAVRSLDEAQRVRGKIALELLRGLIRANPVDTGRMRAGWVVSAGSPSNFVPPEAEVKNASSSGGARSTVRSAYSAMASGQTPRLSSLPLAIPIYVTNNVEYAGHVNDRHPSKAGFVEAVIASLTSRIANRFSA